MMIERPAFDVDVQGIDAGTAIAVRGDMDIASMESLDAALAKDKLDAIVAPSGGPAWLIDLVNGDSGTGGSSTLAAVAGYPNVTVPAGWARGLPLGVSFMGAAWSEPTLIRLAHAYEGATKARRPPRFLRTAALTAD